MTDSCLLNPSLFFMSCFRLYRTLTWAAARETNCDLIVLFKPNGCNGMSPRLKDFLYHTKLDLKYVETLSKSISFTKKKKTSSEQDMTEDSNLAL